jgi:hypothetical protein
MFSSDGCGLCTGGFGVGAAGTARVATGGRSPPPFASSPSADPDGAPVGGEVPLPPPVSSSGADSGGAGDDGGCGGAGGCDVAGGAGGGAGAAGRRGAGADTLGGESRPMVRTSS